MNHPEKTGLVAEAACKKHLTGDGHPERPERFDAVMQGIKTHARPERLHALEIREAKRHELEYVHHPTYLDVVKRDVAAAPGMLSTGDTVFGTKASFTAALRATGGVLNAVDAVIEGRVRNAFSAMRPPGHHATPNVGMGFCFFNSVAIAARHAQKQFGIERVLIVDWDVHHGNGTQDIFYRDPSVFYFSIHQSPCYPGTGDRHETGAGPGEGFTCNCPVPPGTDGAGFIRALDEQLVPKMKSFKPEFILISAGFDARVDDPIGSCDVRDEDFVTLTERLLDMASQYAGNRLVSLLEGGYGLPGLASASGMHVNALSG